MGIRALQCWKHTRTHKHTGTSTLLMLFSGSHLLCLFSILPFLHTGLAALTKALWDAALLGWELSGILLCRPRAHWEGEGRSAESGGNMQLRSDGGAQFGVRRCKSSFCMRDSEQIIARGTFSGILLPYQYLLFFRRWLLTLVSKKRFPSLSFYLRKPQLLKHYLELSTDIVSVCGGGVRGLGACGWELRGWINHGSSPLWLKMCPFGGGWGDSGKDTV